MSADVNEVCRELDELGIEYTVTENGHEVFWYDEWGVRWSFFGRVWAGRGTRLCAYDINPSVAVKHATGRAVPRVCR